MVIGEIIGRPNILLVKWKDAVTLFKYISQKCFPFNRIDIYIFSEILR